MASVLVRIICSYFSYQNNLMIRSTLDKQSKLIELNKGHYYYIVNKKSRLALTFRPSKDKFVTIDELDQSSMDQIWMIDEVLSFQYEIVHALTTEVLTNHHKGAYLKPGKQTKADLYFLQKSDPENNPNQYWIKQNKLSKNYLHYDSKVICGSIIDNDDGAKWELTRITSNNQLSRCCLIQFAYSNLFLDVPEASTAVGVTIIQWALNKRCNQRWKIQMQGQAYRIINLRSQLSLAIKNKKNKVGARVIQQKPIQNEVSQLWNFKHESGQLYSIKSCLESNLNLGVEKNSMDQGAEIVVNDQQAYNFWRISGKNFQK